ncbi:helix-turn-helix domain-containing protein [Acetonema longum]|nr:helix-turn-helix transcriptional regulator [Acetonema longum]
MKDLREQLGLTQDEVANKVAAALREMGSKKDFSQSQYSRYEKGIPKLWPQDVMEAVAQALGVTSSYLLSVEDQFSHHSDEVLEWLKKPESAPYAKEAFIAYLKEQA